MAPKHSKKRTTGTEVRAAFSNARLKLSVRPSSKVTLAEARKQQETMKSLP